MYEKGGEQKKLWHTIGELILWPAREGQKSESYSMKLYAQPDTKLYIFEQKERGSKPSNSDDEI